MATAISKRSDLTYGDAYMLVNSLVSSGILKTSLDEDEKSQIREMLKKAVDNAFAAGVEHEKVRAEREWM